MEAVKGMNFKRSKTQGRKAHEKSLHDNGKL